MKRSAFYIVVLGLSSAVILAGESFAQEAYDYFRNIQYPGHRRPDVDLDKVEEDGDAAAYARRVVHWWPKKGVDIVDVPEGVELRTWTIRTPEIEPLMEASIHRKGLPETLRNTKQFQAHLLGFRGVGSDFGFPFPDPIGRRVRGEGMCPAVVLRLEDGRKRCFTRGTFIDADQQYLRDLYRKEMDRLRQTQAPHPTKVDPNQVRSFPQGELYQPGTYRLESDFFVFVSGSQSPPDGSSAWVNENHKELTRQYREATVRHFEDVWAYLEYAGERRRFWNDPVESWYKYRVQVPGTMRDGFHVIPGFAGGGYNACEIKDASWPAFYHEWAHGTPTSTDLGSGEAKCDSYQPMADPTLIGKVEHQILRPFKNLFHGWYPAALAWTMMGDDPNWGYAAIATLHSQGERVATPMHKIAKLGEERGIWSDGIRGVGDFMGQIGARFAEYDWELEGELRATFPAPNRAYLVALDREERRYRSDPVEAPEPFGVNLIRLEADPDATEIQVDFQGHFDPDTFSDWRACIVAVGEDGLCRYSPLWNKGVMRMEVRPGDQRYWLTVTATPYALSNAHQDGWWYESPYAYQYPYDVRFSGCRPVGPHAPVGVNRNMDLIGPSWMRNAITGGPRGAWIDLPHPVDTPQYAEMKERLESLLEKAPMALKVHLQEGLFNDPLGGPRMRALEAPVLLQLRAQYLLENAQGRRHPNGGGWVANSATVARTAFVGPDCMVLDGARVLDHASIEDYAVLSGEEVLIKDHAKVYGKAIVSGHVELSEYARVRRNIINRTTRSEYQPDDVGSPYRVEITSVGKETRTGPELRRFLFDGLESLGLQANYQFDQRETILMEDHYQEHGRDAYQEDLIFYNGLLFGRPGFTQERGVGAATFNGRDQYAEAASDVADLGEITLDISLKWAGGGHQTLFDFGTSEDNCFKLVLTSSGEPVLQMRVAGKNEEVRSRKAIENGQWTQCRVEIDGETIRLWVNNEKAAEAESAFRAADVYPAGVEKRNFVAAARGGKNPFHGAIEHFRIFHVVHPDFTKVPEVPLVSSRRICPGYRQRYAETYADYPLREMYASERLEKDELHVFYKNFYADIEKRRAELQWSEEVDRLEKELEALNSESARKRAELTAEFNSRPDVEENRARYNELQQRVKARLDEVRKQNYASELAEMDTEAKAAQNLVTEIEDAARAAIADHLAPVQEEMDTLAEERIARRSELPENDPDALSNRAARRAADEELAQIDRRQDPEGYERLQLTRRTLDQEYNQICGDLFRQDAALQHTERRSERLRHVMRSMVESQIKLIDPRHAEAVRSLHRWGGFNQRRSAIDDAILAIPDIAAIRDEMETLSENDGGFIGDRGFIGKGMRDFVDKGVAELGKRIKAMEARVHEARRDATIAMNWDEFNALPGGWTANQQLDAIRRRVMARELPVITECQRRFGPAFAGQQARWHFKVDWDDRLDWEKKPFDELTPIVQNWLRRLKPYVYE